MTFIEMLCDNEEIIENIIYKFNLLEYFKQILIFLYDKIKIILKEFNSISIENDRIKIYVIHKNIDDEHSYKIKLLDIFENKVKNVDCSCILGCYFDMKKHINWRYTSVCRDFSYLEQLYLLLEAFSNILFNIKDRERILYNFSFFDLIIMIINSFDSMKKLMDSSYSDIVFKINERGDLYSESTYLVILFFMYFWDRKINKDIILIIKSFLWFSLYYVKNPSFQLSGSVHCLEKLKRYCLIFLVIIDSCNNSSGEYFNSIKSLFKESGWTECLIDIFNALNPFPSSSKQSPPFLSFLLSVSPSEDIAEILKYSSLYISLLEDENTPKEISQFIQLTNF
jgi:hypothetical protein